MYWHQSHQLSQFKSIAPRQVAFIHDFAEILRRLFLLWRHNFVTWLDPTKFFSPKVAQRMPHKLWKISARSSKRCGVQLRKTHGGLHQPPPHPDQARVKPAPCWGGGVWTPPPPLRFFEDSEKNGGAQRRRVFTHLTPHLFRNFCENFGPRPCKVRSPGQVKWPNYKITFPSCHGYNVSGKVMKLSEYDKIISAYKTYILDFLYRWPQVRSFLRRPHYKSMGKKSTLLYLLWRKRFWVELYRIGQLWTIRVKNCITYPSKGHLRSPEVTNRHLQITFDQKEIEMWDWCQYVRPGQANRLICNMTPFGHHVTLAWLDLRSNFGLDLSKSFCIWFDVP